MNQLAPTGPLSKLVIWFLHWGDPWWWVWLSAMLFFIILIRPIPIFVDKDDQTTSHYFLVMVRRILLTVLAFLLALPILHYLLFGSISALPSTQSAALLSAWWKDMAGAYWTAPAAGILGGLFMGMLWYRFALPYISAWWIKFAVKQPEDGLSDVRNEMGRFAAKSFDPRKFYKAGFIFLGLGENNKPIYVPMSLFRETHLDVIGPTRFGKGVLLNTILDQCIHLGHTTIAVDPKGDKYMPFIMAKAAKDSGRRFIYLDLNPTGRGSWAPFEGGAERDRRARVISAFKLGQSGTDADVYKARERSILDEIAEESHGRIKAMISALEARGLKDEARNLYDNLKEWARVDTFSPKKGAGLSVEKSLLNNAVIYIKGSIRDQLVRHATRVLITEIVQEIGRLSESGQLPAPQITLAVDEVRFVIGNELVDALATIAGMGCNMVLSHQSVMDLRNLDDKSLNAMAVERSFVNNCQLKVLYKAADPETSKWGADLSGTRNISVPQMQRLNVNHWGGEQFEGQRAINQVEESFITQNELIALEPRTGILYQPNALPQPIFTAWVPVDITVRPWERPTQPMPATSPAPDAA